jgi:CheY-like chemotaxis protein
MLPLKTILIVDDDEDDRSLFSEALKIVDKSYRLTTAINGEQAIHMLSTDTLLPEYIFLDINMPGINGWQCFVSIRKMEHLKQVPVIIYTTSLENDYYKKLKELGELYFITKPSRFSDIKKAILHVINKEWDKIEGMNKTVYSLNAT